MMAPLLDPVENAGLGEATSHATVHSDSLVLAELWVSFISLLRSHLGALQTTGKLAQAVFTALEVSSIDETSGIEIADLSRSLHLSLQASTGVGEWSLSRLGAMIAAGAWKLRADATVTIDGGQVQDMELAGEEFLRKLWSRTPSAEATARLSQPERTQV